MIRKTFSVGVAVVLLATMLSVWHVQAAEACYGCACGNDCANIVTLTCDTITFNLPGADDITYDLEVFDTSFTLIHDYTGANFASNSASQGFSAQPGYFLELAANNDLGTLGGLTLDIVVPPCSSTGAVTWFTPGDARVSGQPGDQIAVYCNKATATTPANIDVWGIINSDGFSLTKVNVSDIVKSGAAFKDGKGGTVFLGGDGTYFFAAWVNGAFGANGQNSFGKTFSCTF